MEVPRLGVKLELQRPTYTTTTAMPDPSCFCDLHCSSWQHQIHNPLSKAKDRTCNLMFLVGFISPAPSGSVRLKSSTLLWDGESQRPSGGRNCSETP
uniref:Uncharacterized protein n=1 Tax=Sus scrofa TaxID=9823 RepID=A0A480EZY0_PIG